MAEIRRDGEEPYRMYDAQSLGGQALKLNARVLEIRWSSGSCGERGCGDPGCVCALCAQPIGVRDDDPRWIAHGDEECYNPDCPLCEDTVPVILFRGLGKNMKQTEFHHRCFLKILEP